MKNNRQLISIKDIDFIYILIHILLMFYYSLKTL